MGVNNLNGVEYASQYVNGLGSNGIANAVTSADCAGGCDATVERNYNAVESYNPPAWNSSASGGTHVEDRRGGSLHDSYFNPVAPLGSGLDAGEWLDVDLDAKLRRVAPETGMPAARTTLA